MQICIKEREKTPNNPFSLVRIYFNLPNIEEEAA